MKYQSIQFLRAVAALMVVVQHTHIAFSPQEKKELWLWPGFSDFGYLGVSLFFVISGFIIAKVFEGPGFSLGAYFWRRFTRIYPLYWLVMGVGIYYYFSRNWFKYEIDSLGLTGMVKSILIFPLKEHPFWAPGWSLEHEVIFYVVAAIINPIFGLRWLAAVMFFLAALGLTFNVGWDYHIFSIVQASFGAGVIAYLLRNREWSVALPISFGALFLCYGYYYQVFSLSSSFVEVVFAVGAGALIVALVDLERKGWNVPKSMVIIGNASFSLYLWHWLVIPLASRWKDLGGAPEMWRWIIVIVSIAAAIGSYYFIEKPLVSFSHGKRFIRKEAVIG